MDNRGLRRRHESGEGDWWLAVACATRKMHERKAPLAWEGDTGGGGNRKASIQDGLRVTVDSG